MTMPSTSIEGPPLRRCENEDASKITPEPSQYQSTEQSKDAITTQSMELNDAFLALEHMRKANLELEFGCGVNHDCCTQCLLESKNANESDGAARRWRKRFRTRRTSPPCFICASPVCGRHSSDHFRKECITICGHCSSLFTMDFIVDTISNDELCHRRKCIAHVIDSYDRALLMLRYSAQFIDDVAEALQSNTQRSNKVGLGSSATGLMSGITGVAAAAAHFAAAATILSPAGPPLLIASILFGGTAAAASTSTEAINYYSEPNQLANKILALHELLNALLRVTTVLKDALLHGRLNVEHYMDKRGASMIIQPSRTKEKIQDDLTNEDAKDESLTTEEALVNPDDNTKVDKEKDGSSASETNVFTRESKSETNPSASGASMDGPVTSETTSEIDVATETKVVAPSNTRLAVSRATTNAMKAAQFATIACGVLSAATIVMEAKQMTDTIERMRAGNPCEKAQVLLSIKELVGKLPETGIIAEECESFLKATGDQKSLY